MLVMLKFLKRKEWLFVLMLAILTFAEVWLELKIPEYITEITKLMVSSGSVAQILSNGGFMILCALAAGVVAVAIGFLSAKIGTGLAKTMRSAIYTKVGTFSPTEMHKFSTASLITRSTNDISQIQQTISMGFQIILRAPIMAIWAICKITTKSFQWSVATAVAVGIMLLGVVLITLVVIPKFKVLQKQTDEINRTTNENLTGLRVVRAFNAENFVENKFEKTNESLTKTQLFTGYSLSFINPVMMLVMNGLSIAIYVIGAFLINGAVGFAEKITLFSDMTVFFSYAMQIIASFIMLVFIFMMMPRAVVSAKRVNEVLDTIPTIVDGVGVSAKQVGTVEFRNVCFQYADAKEPVVKNISFSAQKGEMVAIIGATGSGKSTIIKLIPRLYDATSGEVLVDGENVKDYKLSELHDKIGYVSQKAVLFSGTVSSNVSMGELSNTKVEDEDVKQAIKNAESKDFVENMENQYQAEVLQGGSNLSGGQKQRLAIARALARNPEILIFDDSFSALDYRTDKNIRATLKENSNQITSIIVAQRIGTIKNCDKIIVIDNGEIVGIGKHEELLKDNEVYKEIALSQLSKEELDG